METPRWKNQTHTTAVMKMLLAVMLCAITPVVRLTDLCFSRRDQLVSIFSKQKPTEHKKFVKRQSPNDSKQELPASTSPNKAFALNSKLVTLVLLVHRVVRYNEEVSGRNNSRRPFTDIGAATSTIRHQKCGDEAQL